MSLPRFYVPSAGAPGEQILLDEDNSRHAVQVLRMQSGETLLLTDGKGHTAHARLLSAHKKSSRAEIIAVDFSPRLSPALTIAISPVKNSSRFEWFLEKATELGTASIIPLLCERTEKQHLRHDRLLNICKSAMLQSGQSWLPDMHMPTAFSAVLLLREYRARMIAHCSDAYKASLADAFNPALTPQIVLIGPEGDFSPTEVSQAHAAGFTEVSLGPTRLRTETAGIYAAAICRQQ